MTKIYVLDKPRQPGPRSPRRNAPAPQLGDAGDPPPPAAAKPPSFLAQVKGDLAAGLAAAYDGDGARAAADVQLVWPYLRDKLTESFYNGVAAGQSGRVKPKASRERGTLAP